MKKFYLTLVLTLFSMPFFAQDAEVVINANLNEKRLSEYLKEYEVVDEWSGAFSYLGPTKINLSGLVQRADLDALFLVKTVKSIDASSAEFKDNVIEPFSFCFNAGLYAVGIESAEEIILPVSIERIDPASFSSCFNLKRVNFEELVNLKEIGMMAFEYCGFDSLYISKATTTLGTNVFQGCNNLQSFRVSPENVRFEDYKNGLYDKEINTLINYPLNNPDKIAEVKPGTDSIALRCFATSANLEEIILPSSLTKIGEQAFSEMTSLKNMTIPAGVKILNDVFSGSSLETITLQEGLEVIGNGAFARCKNLKSIQIPASVKVIDFMAFYSDQNLASVKITGPSSLIKVDEKSFEGNVLLEEIDFSNTALTFIGDNAFNNCSALHTIKIPASVEEIGVSAFANCSKMDLTAWPAKLEKIGSKAFDKNSSLSSIHIGEFVQEIGKGAFSNCANVSDLSVNDNNQNYVLYESMLMTSDGSNILFVSPHTTIETLDLSQMAEITDYVLAGNRSIKNVVLGSELTSIGEGAFSGMEALESINLSTCGSLSSIGNYAFKGSEKLVSVIFPNDDPTKSFTIGKEAFYGCTSLTNVVLPAQLTMLASNAFTGCTSLVKADLSKSQKLFSFYNVFNECPALAEFKLHNKISAIGVNGLEGCLSLKSFEIPDALSSNINGATFFRSGIENFIVKDSHPSFKAVNGAVYSKDLTQLVICPTGFKGEFVIPEGVMKVGVKAFSGALGVTKVHFPASLSAPGYQNVIGSFHEMHGLKEFAAGADHATISVDNGVVYNKTKKDLIVYPAGKIDKSITLFEDLETISNGAFDGNQVIEEIIFPSKLTRIGMSFINAKGLRKVELPASIKSLTSSFEGSTNLSEVVCHAVTPPAIDNFTFRSTNVTSAYVPAGSVQAYQNNKYWAKYNILPISPTSLDADGFDQLRITCEGGHVAVTSEKEINSVSVYSLHGELIKKSNTGNFSLNVNLPIVIVKVQFVDGTHVSGKIIVK